MSLTSMSVTVFVGRVGNGDFDLGGDFDDAELLGESLNRLFPELGQVVVVARPLPARPHLLVAPLEVVLVVLRDLVLVVAYSW